MEAFYAHVIGFTRTESVTWKGHRCLFLGCGTEHHSLALYPMALRKQLGLSPRTTTLSFGVQVATYLAVEPQSDTYTGEPYLGPWG